MATLIPAAGSCLFESSGERRLADRLEKKLDDDNLIWYNVPVGPRQSQADFIVIHPRRGVLILEVRDWRPQYVKQANRQAWDVIVDKRLRAMINPLAQARFCATQVVQALERDPQLTHRSGPHEGKLAFPWGYGVVLTRITRAQFEAAALGDAVEPHHVICQDEMLEDADPRTFQDRLGDMFPHWFGGVMSLPQLDRVRWNMFPQMRIHPPGAPFDDSDALAGAELPDTMDVMDLQQEQLARSLGDGHSVIHGVAGSGKTMVMCYRAELLAKVLPEAKPILLLTYNEPLAVKLAARMEAKGLQERIHVRHFHKWCREQLMANGQPIPQFGAEMFDGMVDNVISAVERGQIPSGQYQAILVDEAHDFQPEWLRLMTRLVDPATNSLLLLFDGSQSIYSQAQVKAFSFSQLGIQAQGRTSVLTIDYRNTRQILQTANLVAADLLAAEDADEDADEDGIPQLRPISSGREGPEPLVIRLPSLRDEAYRIADLLAAAHQDGHAWSDMAVICRQHSVLDVCATALRHRKLPHHVRKTSGDFKPEVDSIKLLTMQVCKGLDFAVVAVMGVGGMPGTGEDEQAEAKLFYTASTRSTDKLIVTASGNASFANMLGIPQFSQTLPMTFAKTVQPQT